MQDGFLYRKVIVGVITTFLFMVGFTVTLMAFGSIQSMADELMVISIVVGFYTVLMIAFYGIPISMLIEYVFVKKEYRSSLGYIFFHVLFGSASYFIFFEWRGMIYGWMAALVFAIVDHIFSKQKIKDSYIVAAIAIPIVMLVVITILLGVTA